MKSRMQQLTCMVFSIGLVLDASQSFAADKIKVTATFSILADMAANVGGDRVVVTTLVKPSQDVHVYQPTPADAAAVARSNVLISNGLSFEGWMDRLVAASGFSGEAIVGSEGLSPLTSKSDDHGHTDNSDTASTDPHAWQSVANAQTYVENIKDGLCKADAAGCADYTRNADTYSFALTTLDAEIKSKFTAIPVAKRKVITSHDAFGYFGRAYGVTFRAPLGISTDQEASAATVAQLIKQIRADNIKAVFVETISNARLIEQIARETGTTLGLPLYADTLSPPDGPAATYLEMMRYNATALAAAMAKN